MVKRRGGQTAVFTLEEWEERGREWEVEALKAVSGSPFLLSRC